MKILYITNHLSIAQCSGGFISDYLNDLTFYGFYELYKDGIITEIVDSTQIASLYVKNKNKIPKQHLWGGMTAFWLIESDDIERTNIEQKIENKYYDLIIYGAARRCLDYYQLVNKCYDRHKIVLLDGNDDSSIHSLSEKHLYFKREYDSYNNHVLPISFSFPTGKLYNINKNKTQDYGTVIPKEKETYVFTNERDYYNDYNKSYYGVTIKKAGWDCMRHYEILGNYCMPFFQNINECPVNSLTTLPKKLIKTANELLQSEFDSVKYYDVLDEAFAHFKEYCLTKSTAKYILEKVI